MLKTNSKKAIENIKNYTINNFDFCNYDDGTTAEKLLTNLIYRELKKAV